MGMKTWWINWLPIKLGILMRQLRLDIIRTRNRLSAMGISMEVILCSCSSFVRGLATFFRLLDFTWLMGHDWYLVGVESVYSSYLAVLIVLYGFDLVDSRSTKGMWWCWLFIVTLWFLGRLRLENLTCLIKLLIGLIFRICHRNKRSKINQVVWFYNPFLTCTDI